MMYAKVYLTLAGFILLFTGSFAQDNIKILSYSLSKQQPGFYNADYTSANTLSLRSRKEISFNNGKSWQTKATGTDCLERIPTYSRREPVTSLFDSTKGAFVTFFDAIDNPNIPKNVKEPQAALKNYYLRYRTSTDNGATWLYDKPVKASERDAINPFSGIERGNNAMYLGDKGSKPILLDNGHILLAVQATILPVFKKKLNKDGLYNPVGAVSYFEVLILDGVWMQDSIHWTIKNRIQGNPARTTRGLFEPTLAQFTNGRILLVARGSNGGKSDIDYQLPSYKWYAISDDEGKTWSKPQPWAYDNGQRFYSPSSMSLLIKHSSGKVFWIGNISNGNPKGNFPRFPLIIAQVNSENMLVKQKSITILDSFKISDRNKGTLDIGHATAIEDRQTGAIIVAFPRLHSKAAREWATVRLKVK